MPKTHESELERLIQSNTWLIGALARVRDLQLPDWAIGGGVIRNLVFDHLHGQPFRGSRDVDVAYFDPADLSRTRDRELDAWLRRRHPEVPWEVTNQAGVHLWFHKKFGHEGAPLTSLAEAVASWPEVCSAVAVRLRDDQSLEIIAPLGIDDLFDLRIRRNPRRVSVETYRKRVTEKRYAERWPKATIVPA